jgi:hypothetical protein
VIQGVIDADSLQRIDLNHAFEEVNTFRGQICVYFLLLFEFGESWLYTEKYYLEIGEICDFFPITELRGSTHLHYLENLPNL